jgi:hypothetical protein
MNPGQPGTAIQGTWAAAGLELPIPDDFVVPLVFRLPSSLQDRSRHCGTAVLPRSSEELPAWLLTSTTKAGNVPGPVSRSQTETPSLNAASDERNA